MVCLVQNHRANFSACSVQTCSCLRCLCRVVAVSQSGRRSGWKCLWRSIICSSHWFGLCPSTLEARHCVFPAQAAPPRSMPGWLGRAFWKEGFCGSAPVAVFCLCQWGQYLVRAFSLDWLHQMLSDRACGMEQRQAVQSRRLPTTEQLKLIFILKPALSAGSLCLQ